MKNKILGDKRKSNFDDNLADYVNQIFDKLPETPEVKPVVSDVRLERVSDGFIFYDLPEVGSVKLLKNYLCGGNKRTHNDWRMHGGLYGTIFVPNTIVLYQMARVLYELRNNDNYKDFVKECLCLFHEDWTKKYSHTGTKVIYGSGLDAVVSHLKFGSSSKTVKLEIPEFTKHNKNWSYLILAPKQSEEKLGNVNVIPDNAKALLQALFGEGYEQAGEIFQYVSPRNKDNLSEVRIWIPTLTNRNSERAVLFGVDSISHYLVIDTDGSIDSIYPARGIVATRENSSWVAK